MLQRTQEYDQHFQHLISLFILLLWTSSLFFWQLFCDLTYYNTHKKSNITQVHWRHLHHFTYSCNSLMIPQQCRARFLQNYKPSQQNPTSKWEVHHLKMKVVSWGLLLCQHFYYFIVAVFMSLVLQDLVTKRQMFHCMWRHVLLTVEKKPLYGLPLPHRPCRRTDSQIMCVRSSHSKHVTGQRIIKHSIINLKRIWYTWRLYKKLYSTQLLSFNSH